MSICRTSLKSFHLKKLITKQEFLSLPPKQAERFIFKSRDGKEHSLFFNLNSPITRKLNRVPLIYDDEMMEVERHSAMYFLSEIKDSVRGGKEATTQKKAESIADFFRFCNDKQIDWLIVPRNKRNKPVYLYSKHLHQLVEDGAIAPSTAKRKMSAIIQFYKNCEEQYGATFFENNPFSHKLVSFTDTKGLRRLALTQEEQIRVTKEISADAHLYIQDGGKLKPLTKEEQRILYEVLNSPELNNNIEMRYVFMSAVLSGARLQSILTMSVKDINVHIDLPDEYSDINHVVKAGRGHVADSKNNKPINIYYSYSWMEKLKLYAKSVRYAKRRDRYFNNIGVENPTDKQMEEAYLFLTNRGTPYYDRQADLTVFNANNSRGQTRTGGGVHDFLANHVLPKMREKLGETYRFHFHDLRATFGVNLRDILIEKYGNENTEEIYKQIQTRLSHNDRKTTELYVKYEPTASEIIGLEQKYREFIGIPLLESHQIESFFDDLGRDHQ